MNISICILNWQAASLTIQCLRSILQLDSINESQNPIDIIVVDNDSQDHSASHIKTFIADSEYHRLHFIQSNENQGYASGNNLAITYSLDQLSPHYIWILNNDTRPARDSLSALLDAANKEPSVAIWGSTLLDERAKIVECAGGSYYRPCLSTYKNALKGLPVDAINESQLKEPLDYIEGAALFVDADIFRQCGLFNEDYFLYFEELDLIRRLPLDRRIAWCKNSLVRHIGGASVVSEVAEYQSNLSALIYTRKHHPHCMPLVVIFRFTAKFFRHTLAGRWKLNKTLVLSYKDYFFNHKTH
jgi:GT2 family glycosyltransferase